LLLQHKGVKTDNCLVENNNFNFYKLSKKKKKNIKKKKKNKNKKKNKKKKKKKKKKMESHLNILHQITLNKLIVMKGLIKY